MYWKLYCRRKTSDKEMGAREGERGSVLVAYWSRAQDSRGLGDLHLPRPWVSRGSSTGLRACGSEQEGSSAQTLVTVSFRTPLSSCEVALLAVPTVTRSSFGGMVK